MDPKKIDAIASQVCRQFPELKGVRPSARPQGEDQTLITFQGEAKAPNGKIIPRIVRVVADAQGKIIKISTSR